MAELIDNEDGTFTLELESEQEMRILGTVIADQVERDDDFGTPDSVWDTWAEDILIDLNNELGGP